MLVNSERVGGCPYISMLMATIVKAVVDDDVSADDEASYLQACHGCREEDEAATQQGGYCKVWQEGLNKVL